MVQFPADFLWGAATSSYQVEGNNANADWWLWEKAAGKEQSGQACRHYELFEQDFDLAQSLHHNAHRFSIEWSRIEPAEGRFSQEQIDHYIKVLQALKARGLEPIVTLHHFTNPIWLSRLGGWERKPVVDYFVRYCDVVVRALAPYVRYWNTINEPTIYFSHAYMFGVWPPQAKSLPRAKIVHDHMAAAHIKAYQRIHEIYRELSLSAPMVSIAHHVQAVMPSPPNWLNRTLTDLRDRWFNFEFIDQVMKFRALDFIGVNYYSRHVIGKAPSVKKNSLGWDIYPQGLCQVLLKLKKYNLPLLITENGICTLDDDLRWEFICNHLKNIHSAMDQGANVMGYLYWSLLDNFEWDKGFGPRFGLIEVNYSTFQRTVRPSAVKYGRVCETRILPQ